jgi:diguanylate cyclase (GGDEF)-like protein
MGFLVHRANYLVVALVVAAVVCHEAVDWMFDVLLVSLWVRITVLCGFCVACSVFGLSLSRAYAKEHTALRDALADNAVLQLQLSDTIGRLGLSLDITELRNQQLQLGTSFVKCLHQCTEEREVVKVVGEFLPHLFPASVGGLYLLQEDGGIRQRLCWPQRAQFVPEVRPRFCPVYQDAKPQVASSHRCSACFECLPAHDHGLVFCLPLRDDLKPATGILCAAVPADQRSSNDASTAALLKMVQGQLLLALSNLKARDSLGDLAVRDALTGAFNRRYLDATLDREIARARRNKSPVAVVLLDLDHFKQLNDTMGHEVGDVVLKAVVSKLQQKSREEDIVCRYGGEEFVVVMPGASALMARSRADQVRRDIHELSKVVRHRRVVSVSAGVAVMPDNALDSSALLQAADLALYQSKHAGRDRVTLARSKPLCT